MNNWLEIISIALWLLGLALILGVTSYSDYRRSQARLPAKMTWRMVIRNGWTFLGALLFCAGMMLDSGSLLEGAVWVLPAVFIIYEWWRSRSQSKLEPRSLITADSGESGPAPNPIVRVAEWVVQTELIWLAILSFFFLFPTPGYTFVLLGLPALWIARRIACGRFIPRTPLDWPILLIMIMVLVSLYASPDMSRSLGHVGGLLFGIGLYYALVEWASTAKRLRWAVAGYAVAGAALGLLGLLGINWADKFPALSRLGGQLTTALSGLSGVPGGINPNELGGALMWVVPVQLSIATWAWLGGYSGADSRWAQRAMLLAVSGVTALILLLTQSRGAWIALLIGLILLLGLAISSRRRLVLAAVVTACLAVALLVGAQLSNYLLHTYGPGLEIMNGVRSVGSRTIIWSHAVYGIKDFPVTGMGMDSFDQLVEVAYPTEAIVPLSIITHAHNQLLQVALDLGLPGLVAYLALLMIGAALTVFAWRGSSDVWGRAVAAGIGAGLLASFVFGITDTVPLGSKPSLLFWGLLAVLVTLWQRVNVKRDA